MLISVIIPTFRPQTYLWECLDSLNRQSFVRDDFEVILVLNGCKDPFDIHIREYISHHPHLNWIYIQTDIPGVSNARNIGLKQATGDYITFIDDDDIVSDNYLAGLYETAIKGVVPLSNFKTFYDGIDSIGDDHISRNYEALKEKDNISIIQARHYLSGPVAKLISKSAAKSTNFDVNLKNGEDTLYVFQISWKLPKVYKCASSDAIYFRRLRKGSASRTISLKDSIRQNLYQIKQVLKTWIRHPFKYNFIFMITRVGGAILGILKNIHLLNIK